LTLALVADSPTTGKFALSNGAADDLYTWELTCVGLRLDLIAKDGTRYPPILGEADEATWSFAVPDSPLGAVRHGETLSLAYEAPAALPPALAPECKLNGIAVQTTYRPPLSLSSR
jgi:hypothetical protein